jgi:TetR/AcrR family transcriptional repressor of lmrAB and yxaGH operons
MSSTRQQIIEKTSELLERQGYHATGLNQIVAESDTPRGSLYYYFPEGKEELAAEAIEYKAQQMSKHLGNHLIAYDDPVEAIYHFLINVADRIESLNCCGGSPMAAVALETSNHSERLRQACAGGYERMQKFFEDKLLAGGFPLARAHTLAVTILAALEGGVILSRAEQNAQPLRLVAEEMKHLLLCASSAP